MYPFIHLGEVTYCESKVSCPRTHHNGPGLGSNPDHLIWSHEHTNHEVPPFLQFLYADGHNFQMTSHVFKCLLYSLHLPITVASDQQVMTTLDTLNVFCLSACHPSCNGRNLDILLDVLVCSIAVYFYELCRILTSP